MRGTVDSGAVRRTAGRRCVACNQQVVDAYLCAECARSSDYGREEPRSLTATRHSRAIERATIRAVEFDHWMSMLSIREKEHKEGWSPPRQEPSAQREIVPRGRPVLLRERNGAWWACVIGRDDKKNRWRRATPREIAAFVQNSHIQRQTVGGDATRRLLAANHMPRFTVAEMDRWGAILDRLAPVHGSAAARSRELARLSRMRAERRRWIRFTELWPRLALVAFADAVSLGGRAA